MDTIFTLGEASQDQIKLNLDDLYERKQQQDLNNLSLFNRILARIHNKIKLVSRQQTKEQHYNEIDWSASSNDSIEIEAKGIPLINDHANEVPIIDLDIIELPNEIESQESISEKSQKNLFE